MNALATVNVNGVRAAATKGLLEWLAATDARAVCLQEVRARPDELPAAFLAALDEGGWHLLGHRFHRRFCLSCGWEGVARTAAVRRRRRDRRVPPRAANARPTVRR